VAAVAAQQRRWSAGAVRAVRFARRWFTADDDDDRGVRVWGCRWGLTTIDHRRGQGVTV
jgi:hypothetical protein